MMERKQVKELMFGSSSLLSVGSFPFLSRFSPHPLLAVYSQVAVIFSVCSWFLFIKECH